MFRLPSRTPTSRRTWAPRLGVAAALLGVPVLTATTAVPAQAYSPNPTLRYAMVDTTKGAGCHRISGTLSVTETSTGCYLDDSFDQTTFLWDSGGWALKVQLYNASGAMIGKVEFHPYDEKLWIYDTADDSDTFYVLLYTDTDGYGPYRGPVNGANTYNFSIAEGANVSIDIYDDAYLTDYIGGFGAIA